MNKSVSSKHLELVTKLREIFQIDRPELNFGIYRILNARASEINDYLQNRLLEKVRNDLGEGAQAQKEQVAQELQEKEAHYRADGMNPDGVPRIKELREKLTQYSAGSNEHENGVFSHLLTFFSRYYDNGDFISQRRYKGDTYSIPYSGEEVVLHWANKDQYYTKSGENFSNYSFKLEDGRTVHFRLVAADTAKDNRKDNDKERRFALVTGKTVTRQDENGDEYEEEILPVEEMQTTDGDKELVVRFEYASQAKGTKQEALVTKAVEAVLGDPAVKARWLELFNRSPTEKSPQRTLLEKHLNNYTTKNTADYFVHKDLGGFLRRELDFYIKNEVMHLDDVQNAVTFDDIENNLRMIQCLRSIAQELVNFLAQLEDFQKKLWLKKKFVVASHYCITLSRLSDDFLDEILKNDSQWEKWLALGLISDKSNRNKEFLKSNCNLMIETCYFGSDFANRLINSIDNIDEYVDGYLFHGDNYQSIRLLSDRYSEKIDAIYIDPPYNTDASEIIYKNGYKHSSWLSLINERMRAGRKLLKNSGVQCVTIDDVEIKELHMLVEQIFGKENIAGVVPIKINPSGRPTEKGFALAHEYGIFSGKSQEAGISKIPRTPEQLKRFDQEDEKGKFEFRNLRREGSNSDRADGQRQYFPIFANLTNGSIRVPKMHWVEEAREWVLDESENKNEVVIYPITDENKEKNWRWSEASIRNDYSQFLARTPQGGISPQVYYKYRPNEDGVTPLTIWTDSKFSATEHGTKLLKNLFKDANFSYPKSIHAVEECLTVMGSGNKTATVLDYFAGSGTTGHAVINLNRNDGGSRRYILVEQGEYFDSVTAPRMQKVIYSNDWKAGVPVAMGSPTSHCFKIIKIEGYEDVLNNLKLNKPSGSEDLFESLPKSLQDDYLVQYFLDIESKSSLLSVQHFKKPFDYTLNIAVDSAGAYEPRKVDLVETFNYLLGMRVKQIDAQHQRGFVTVTGTLPNGESCLVLWRDCEKIDYDELRRMANRLDIEAANNPYAVIYINGDHNIPASYTPADGEDAAGWAHKIRPIEPEFLERMFSMEDI
ncbi:DNA methylase N-4/N-6 [Oxalobacteraceae bacterium]